MSNIQSTTEYSIFKFLKFNRPVDKNHVKKLITSISSNNLLEFCPILVDNSMQIIDGQHRVLAAKDLGIPIFYQIKGDVREEDIVLLNDSNKRWTLTDYVTFYAKKGNPEYQKILALSDKYDLSINIILNLFGKDKDAIRQMKSGKLRPLDMQCAEYKIRQLMEITALIKQYLTKTYVQFVKNCRFLRSLVVFLSDDDIVFEDFKKKVYWRINSIRVCNTLAEYMDMWDAIYSFRRRKGEV